MNALQDMPVLGSFDPDEQWYLSTYPDVARAIMEGRFASGFEHYAQHGEREGRRAPPGDNWVTRIQNSPAGTSRAILSAMAEARLPRGGGIRPLSPRTPRELLGAFAGYDESRGLSSVLDRIDSHPSDCAQIYWAVLARRPSAAELRGCCRHSSRDLFESLIISEEFQSGIVKYVLNAHPEKRRFLFVHVPKCAGTDLSAILSKVLPSIHHTLSIDAWTGSGELFSALRELALDLERSDGIFVRGHHTLQWFIDNGLSRPSDRLFTIIRDPWDRLLSQVNYIVTRINADSNGVGTDTRQWLEQLGLKAAADVDSEELALRVLRQQNMIQREVICSSFGKGNFSDAVANLVECDIEITETSRYNAWLSETWGISSNTKINRSRPVLRREMLSLTDCDRVEGLIGQDLKLFALVKSKLEELGSSYIRGADLG